ncbi:MAG: hypothetical protein OXU41_00245 [Gammaproteobacteria bacterium]|nr:hypothetical protein [Gammaproteobacteria bacterium]MDD9869952.1 hypothetical protein [Gammaproteobacteria bacterium]
MAAEAGQQAVVESAQVIGQIAPVHPEAGVLYLQSAFFFHRPEVQNVSGIDATLAAGLAAARGDELDAVPVFDADGRFFFTGNGEDGKHGEERAAN